MGMESPVWGRPKTAAGPVQPSPSLASDGFDRLRDAEEKRPPAPVVSPPICVLLGLTAFNFPYGAVCTTMGLFVLPKEALRLFERSDVGSAPALGGFLVVVGLSQLICPYVGLVSDRCTSRWGRRRPYIACGVLLACLSLGVMWSASRYLLRWAYCAGLLTAMLGLNVAYSAQCGLVPDFVPEQKQGAASGIVAVMQLAGSMSGFVFVIITRHMEHQLCYPAYMVLLAASASLICCAAKEQPLDKDKLPLSWREVSRAYVIDVTNNLEFFWVFVGRTFFYVAVSCQAFMFYYLRDALGTHDESERRERMAAIALIGQGMGALCAYPFGRLSDRATIGRKPLVYTACFVMCVVYASFILTPLLASPAATIRIIYVTAALYGIGNGCYLSVDYALALDTLPSKAASAQGLGIWGIAAFIGSAIGPMIWGGVLGVVGRGSVGAQADAGDEGYLFRGYVAMLSGGCVASFAAGFFIRFVRTVR